MWNAFTEEGHMEDCEAEDSLAAVFRRVQILFHSARFKCRPCCFFSLYFSFFSSESTFPLLRMNRFDGTFTSFIQPILVFLRISH